MTAQHVRQFGPALASFLEPGEQLLDITVVQPTAGVTAGVGVGPTDRLASTIARAAALRGEQGSLAWDFPRSVPTGERMLLSVTDRRVLMHTVSARNQAQAQWSAPRSAIAGVERRRRIQLMAKFRLHFIDGSWVSVMTMRRRNIEGIADQLSRFNGA